MKMQTVVIAEIVGGGICVSSSDGSRVYDVIKAHVLNGHRVQLDFKGVTRLTTAFLNAAIGQLYGDFSEEKAREHLAPPVHAEPWHLNRLKLSVDRAKEYFRDPDAARTAFTVATGIEDDQDH